MNFCHGSTLKHTEEKFIEEVALSVLMHSEVTGQIIGAAFEVWRVLGYGFLEKVYENALVIELGLRSLQVQQQFDIDVHYKGSIVGHYTSDLFAASK